ncbi:MAG TPA: P-loop NTPase, partial [Lysobacter sp.]|nr:P-loop NTPase [Lysobacter sp.]
MRERTAATGTMGTAIGLATSCCAIASAVFDSHLITRSSVMSEAVQERIAALPVPGSAMSMRDAQVRVRAAQDGPAVAVSLLCGFPVQGLRAELEAAIAAELASTGSTLRSLELTQRITSHAVQPNLSPLPSVRNIIAIGSGKGGVGKSTTAVNLALALAADGARVGVLDADVYGPSVPMMLGLTGRPDSPDGKTIEPMRVHGIEAMSIGLLVEQETPMIWRGPMATSALT